MSASLCLPVPVNLFVLQVELRTLPVSARAVCGMQSGLFQVFYCLDYHNSRGWAGGVTPQEAAGLLVVSAWDPDVSGISVECQEILVLDAVHSILNYILKYLRILCTVSSTDYYYISSEISS